MTLTNPTAVIQSLADVIIANSTTWLSLFADTPAATAALWYPSAPAGTGMPMMILQQSGSHAFKLIILSTASIGTLQDEAHAIALEIMSRYRLVGTGLVIVDEPEVGEVGEPSDWDKSGGETANAIEITGKYGISL